MVICLAGFFRLPPRGCCTASISLCPASSMSSVHDECPAGVKHMVRLCANVCAGSRRGHRRVPILPGPHTRPHEPGVGGPAAGQLDWCMRPPDAGRLRMPTNQVDPDPQTLALSDLQGRRRHRVCCRLLALRPELSLLWLAAGQLQVRYLRRGVRQQCVPLWAARGGHTIHRAQAAWCVCHGDVCTGRLIASSSAAGRCDRLVHAVTGCAKIEKLVSLVDHVQKSLHTPGRGRSRGTINEM